MSADIQVVPIEKTSTAGNPNAGTPFSFPSSHGPVKWIQACWNGEVIKGLAIKFHGDDPQRMYTVGDWNNTHKGYHTSFVDLRADDLLSTLKIFTSLFGHVSVRGMHMETRLTHWSPGNVTDTSILDVKDRAWMGIFGTVNPDKFINSLGFWVTAKK